METIKTNDIKANNKKTLLLVLLLLVLIFVVVFGAFLLTKKPVVAFYGLSDNIVQNISEQLGQMQIKEGKSFVFKTKIYSPSISLEQQLKKSNKPDIIFLPQGASLDYAVGLAKKYKLDSKKEPLIKEEYFSDMPTSVSQTAKKTDSRIIQAFPILMDTWEVMYDNTNFSFSGINAIVSLKDLQKLCAFSVEKMPAALILPSGDARGFWGLITTMAEATGGTDNIAKIKETIQGSNDYKEVASLLCQKDGALQEVVDLLTDWYKNKVIFASSLDFSFEEVKGYLDENIAAAAIIPLSCHRQLSQKALYRYSSTYIPALYLSSHRNFVADITTVAPLKDNSVTRQIVPYLLKQETQADLCRRTGLVPVSKSCVPPDREIDDARYWVAATDVPCQNLFYDAFSSPAFAKSLANEIITYIKNK